MIFPVIKMISLQTTTQTNSDSVMFFNNNLPYNVKVIGLMYSNTQLQDFMSIKCLQM